MSAAAPTNWTARAREVCLGIPASPPAAEPASDRRTPYMRRTLAAYQERARRSVEEIDREIRVAEDRLRCQGNRMSAAAAEHRECLAAVDEHKSAEVPNLALIRAMKIRSHCAWSEYEKESEWFQTIEHEISNLGVDRFKAIEALVRLGVEPAKAVTR